MHDLLSEGCQLDLLLVLKGADQVSNLVVAHQHPFLILFALDLCDLLLDGVSPDVVFLLGQLLFHFTQVYYLAGLALSLRDRTLHNLSELLPLLVVPLQGFALHALCLRLVLHELLVPVFIELSHLLKVRGFHFPALLLEALHQFSPPLPLQFGLQLGKTLLDCLCLEVLARLFAGFLMREENLPELG